jgi:two-component system nitrate/nitrite response regulator NarL
MITVVVAARMRLYRDGMADFLGHSPNLTVAATAATSAEALEHSRRLDPEVLLLDIGNESPPGTVPMLVAALPLTAVVVLGVSDAEEDVLAWIEAGAAGYVTRDESLEELTATVNHVVRGETRCSPRIAATLMRRVAAIAAEGLSLPAHARRLTSREREILSLIEVGLSNKQIATELSIQLATVKNHVHNILDKLEVSRRGEAAARARTATDLHRTI